MVHDSIVDERGEKGETVLVLEVDVRGDDWMHQMKGRHAGSKFPITVPFQKGGGFQACKQSREGRLARQELQCGVHLLADLNTLQCGFVLLRQ